MHGIFLSYSFKNHGQPLLRAVRAIIDCAGFRTIDGRALEGFQVGPEVQKKLATASGVVCVVSPEAHESGWVNAEFFQAVGQGKSRLFMLRHETVQLPNPYQGVATSEYSDADTLSAITTLASTLGLWKQALGNPVRAVLLPTDLGEQAYQQNATCEYRTEEEASFEESEWQEARLKPIDAAVHAILPEVPQNHSVQIKLTFGGRYWTSAFMPQDLRLELKQ